MPDTQSPRRGAPARSPAGSRERASCCCTRLLYARDSRRRPASQPTPRWVVFYGVLVRTCRFAPTLAAVVPTPTSTPAPPLLPTPTPAPPPWPGEWTAIGTLALALVTLAAVITTIVITALDRQEAQTRLDDDRKRAAELLAEERLHAGEVLVSERQAADERLTRQLEHSQIQASFERQAADDRLARQLEHSEAQLLAERTAAREQEQEAGAWAVQVLLADFHVPPASSQPVPDASGKRLVATVINYGPRAISQVRVQFSPDGASWVSTFRTEHLPNVPPSALTAPVDTIGLRGVLPSGSGMRFSSDVIGEVHLTSPHVAVRWRDHLSQSWEYEQGEVRRIDQAAVPPW